MARKCIGGCGRWINDDRISCISCKKKYGYWEDGLYDSEEAMKDGNEVISERPDFLRLDKVQLNRAVQEVKVFLMKTDRDIRDYYLKKHYPDMVEKEIKQAIKDINKERGKN